MTIDELLKADQKRRKKTPMRLEITTGDRLRSAIYAALEQIEAGQTAKAYEYLKEASRLE